MIKTKQYPWTLEAQRVFRVVLCIQFLISLLIAWFTSTWFEAFAIGLPIILLPLFLSIKFPHEAFSRHAIGLAAQLMTALHLQQTMGMTELHFEVFVMLAFLAFFRDWRVIASSTAFVIVHHLSFYVLQSIDINVYVIETSRVAFYILAIHAIFALLEGAVLGTMARRNFNEAVSSRLLQDSVNKIMGADGVIHFDDKNLHQAQSLIPFNRMITTVKTLIVRVDAATSSVSALVGKLKGSTNVLDLSVEQQNIQIVSISTSLEKLSATINEVAELSESAHNFANEAQQHTSATQLSIDGSSRNIGQLKETLEVTLVAISDLSTKCINISDVMQSIKAVAEQTNLLALNAAIESARAGEHGRGFAVVADEVRNLAIKSKESAEEIEVITSELTDSAAVSVDRMQTCVQMVEGAVESSNSATQNMQSVSKGITQVSANVTTVANSASNQANTSESIYTSAKELQQLFKGESEQVQSVKDDINALQMLSAELTQQLKQFDT